MKNPYFQLFLLAAAIALFLGAGCSHYDGPTVSTVGVGGSYTDKSGETYGGTVNVGLAYPSPSPARRVSAK